MPRIVGAEAKKRVGNEAMAVEAIVAPSLKAQTKPPGQVNRIVGGFFGPPKSGKTTAAASGHNTLLIEFDPDGDATETLRDRTDVSVYKPGSWHDIDEMTKSLLTVDRETWDWWVLDSVTFWAEILGGRELSTQLKAGKDPRQVYQRIGASINQTFRDLLTGPASVIFTAQIKADVVEEDATDITAIGPDEAVYPVSLAVTPMVYKVLGPSASLIGRTYRRSDGYYVNLNDGGRSPASNRLGIPSPMKSSPGLLQNLLDGIKERNVT